MNLAELQAELRHFAGVNHPDRALTHQKCDR